MNAVVEITWAPISDTPLRWGNCATATSERSASAEATSRSQQPCLEMGRVAPMTRAHDGAAPLPQPPAPVGRRRPQMAAPSSSSSAAPRAHARVPLPSQSGTWPHRHLPRLREPMARPCRRRSGHVPSCSTARLDVSPAPRLREGECCPDSQVACHGFLSARRGWGWRGGRVWVRHGIGLGNHC